MKRKNKYILIIVTLLFLTTTGCKKSDDSLTILKGTWVADVDNQIVMVTGENGDKNTTIGGEHPYYLKFDGKGNYTLELDKNYTEKGTYTIDDDNNVNFLTNSGLIRERCQLKDEKELSCSDGYASLYVKK